jgi:hypothetical protein
VLQARDFCGLEISAYLGRAEQTGLWGESGCGEAALEAAMNGETSHTMGDEWVNGPFTSPSLGAQKACINHTGTRVAAILGARGRIMCPACVAIMTGLLFHFRLFYPHTTCPRAMRLSWRRWGSSSSLCSQLPPLAEACWKHSKIPRATQVSRIPCSGP